MFEPFNFVTSLSYMLKGMFAIFVVMGVIILVTALLNRIFRDRKEDKQQ